MTMTFQALSSALDIPARARPGHSFLRRFVDALIEGRQHKADLDIAEYLDRHPEYRVLDGRIERQSPGR
jgi:hypothetical protein